jgi:CRP-like cAMP-binding protein
MKPEELERSFSDGQCILARGASPRELYVVRSGGVVLDWGGLRPAERRDGGALFGELCGILGQPSPYEVRAVEETVVLVLDLALIHQLCRQCTEFSMRLTQQLARDYAALLGEHAHAGFAEVTEDTRRLAAVLLARMGEGDPPLCVAGSLEELAAASHLSMLCAYRALHDLLDQGIVQIVEDQLRVLEPAVLREAYGAALA